MASTAVRGDTSSRPKAVVYRGPAVCEGCPEAVGQLLSSSPQRYEVTYAGPEEDVDVTPEALRGVQVYAQPGGPDLETAWDEVKGYNDAIQAFVTSGGYYLGFCLGAYLAGHTPGFGLLPNGADTDAENSNPDSQVTSGDDTVIQVDWTFVSGRTQRAAWMYFQDGAVITGLPSEVVHFRGDKGRVLGRYSKTGDVAASVTSYGRGWVGLVGPHPEATQDWYTGEGITNPDGVNLSIGYDFIAATLAHGKINRDASTTSLGDDDASTSAASGSRHSNPLARLSSRVSNMLR